MRFIYKAYGLVFDSDIELPFFLSTPEERPEVQTSFTLKPEDFSQFKSSKWARRHPLQSSASNGIEVWVNGDWNRLHYPITPDSTLRFYLSNDGTKLVADKPKSMLIDDMRSFVLGSTFGCLLRQRNQICLHASVLSINDRAFALVGYKGAGKSTTSAALLNSGAKLISDDIAVLNFEKNEVIVEPGYPAIRLLPSSLAEYSDTPSKFKSVLSFSDKKYVPVSSPELNWQFNENRLPLEAIYILSSRTKNSNGVSFEPLSNAKAMMSLTPHSYTPYMLNEAQKIAEFKGLAKTIRCVSVKSISCDDDLKMLPNIASSIIADFTHTEI
ncbi:hypothetical protein NBRC116583_10670 [Arenicella sp. 4NH20-0111]|uniref:hypothetical protein n=1 Tax=Arenicella sp. 4NH20-0111 TaxID=3127648 RepID=UPI0031042C6E